MGAPVVDIVLVGYRSETFLPRLLRDIEDLSALPHAIHYWDNIGNPKNLPMAWNDEVKRGKAPYICIMQPDMVITPDWDLRLCNALEIDRTLGVAHAVGYATENHRIPTREEMVALSRIRSAQVDRLDYDVVGMDALRFFLPMMRRRDWESLRGMDERLRFIRMESEFFARLRYRRNLLYGYVHDVRAWHRIGASIEDAVNLGEMNMRTEHEFSDALWARIRRGELMEWHDLPEAELVDVRRNRTYDLRPRRREMTVHIIPPPKR